MDMPSAAGPAAMPNIMATLSAHLEAGLPHIFSASHAHTVTPAPLSLTLKGRGGVMHTTAVHLYSALAHIQTDMSLAHRN